MQMLINIDGDLSKKHRLDAFLSELKHALKSGAISGSFNVQKNIHCDWSIINNTKKDSYKLIFS